MPAENRKSEVREVEWRDVPGFEGTYKVSSDGRVASVDRCDYIPNRWGGVTMRRLRGKELKPQKHPAGYVVVPLSGKQFLIHRLVAMAFIPGDWSLEVNHKNGCRDSNGVENLEWVTPSENQYHANSQLPRRKHSAARDVVVFGEDGAMMKFPSVHATAVHLGVSAGSVHSALNRNHKCAGFDVCYA